jgi:hypothetical protein
MDGYVVGKHPVGVMEKEPQSHRVGKGRQANGYPIQRYQALVPIPCASCGEEIGPDEHFSRHRQMLHDKRTFPVCPSCRPFAAGLDDAQELEEGSP